MKSLEKTVEESNNMVSNPPPNRCYFKVVMVNFWVRTTSIEESLISMSSTPHADATVFERGSI